MFPCFNLYKFFIVFVVFFTTIAIYLRLFWPFLLYSLQRKGQNKLFNDKFFANRPYLCHFSKRFYKPQQNTFCHLLLLKMPNQHAAIHFFVFLISRIVMHVFFNILRCFLKHKKCHILYTNQNAFLYTFIHAHFV